MCYHISLTKTKEEIKERFYVFPEALDVYKPFFHRNGFEKEYIYIIKDIEPYNFTPAYWGMLPENFEIFQRDDFLRKTNTLNARAMHLFESPLFRKPLEYNRCLIIADGFFEPHQFNGNNYPHYIRCKDRSLFSFAGIYTELDDDIYTVSLITTVANDFFKEIHNKKNKHGEYRMPLILDEKDEIDWLDPDLPFQEVMELLFSFTNKDFEAYTVSKDVMNSRVMSNRKDVLEPVVYPELNTLF
ncbi:SOS response-associated peptidase [Mangrovimonas sp. ST2L15]|uniref:SOS response-associated peptidase n=1 Tax=Mangrovimonas sp. ST2L15 TaxID=1645916 RepID=UPI0006B4848C|nr:SOS response-associated peptidase [Mangrovimonas sp. ST2L15]